MNSAAPSRLLNLPKTAKGDRIYAIGDVHGRFDLLSELLDTIRSHNATLPPAKSTHIIVLGDIVDRGPASASVIKNLYEGSKRNQITTLLGNHEDVMLRAIDGEPGAMRAWLRIGGTQTLESFGLKPPQGEFDPLELSRELIKKIPQKWMEWLRTRPLCARSGDYFFCHAGIRPGTSLDRQSRSDLLWIREEFLEHDEAYDAVIVHGHSISPDVELRHNRIGVDTGAYRTNMLTAAYLENNVCAIISTGEHSRMAGAA